MKNNFDIIFYCDSNQYTGFGHASRCSRLSVILKKLKKKLRIGVIGNISPKSKLLMLKSNKNLIFIENQYSVNSRIAFIDKMFDYEDPNVLDKKFLLLVKKKSDVVIVMFSGIYLKSAQNDIIYIGYQPVKNILWDLSFAPTQISKLKIIPRRKNCFFLALGGNQSNTEIKKLIQVINLIEQVKYLEILVSPVNKNINLDDISIRNNLKLTFISNVKNLSPYLLKSTLVISSFGNLCYEAIAHKTPTIIVAQKKFQAKYAELLERENNVYSLGFPSAQKLIDLKLKIIDFWEGINTKENQKRSCISLNGLQNIADIIKGHL